MPEQHASLVMCFTLFAVPIQPRMHKMLMDNESNSITQQKYARLLFCYMQIMLSLFDYAHAAVGESHRTCFMSRIVAFC